MSADVGVAVGSSVVTLAGRQVHLEVSAGVGPWVVLLGGCGVPSHLWADVRAALPGRSVVALDRPGLVETPWPGRLPALAEEVATLAALVQRIGGPVVLVGHSMAGLHAEALVRQHRDLVLGLVLLDSSVEWDPKPPRSTAAWLATARGVRVALQLRPLRPLGPLADRLMVAAQSRRRRVFGPVSAEARLIYRRPDTVASVVAEQAAYGQQVVDLARLRESTTWPRTPTIVVTAAGDGGSTWVEDQRRLAELLSGRQVVVDDARHLIMIDRPDLVVEAVRTLSTPKDDDRE